MKNYDDLIEKFFEDNGISGNLIFTIEQLKLFSSEILTYADKTSNDANIRIPVNKHALSEARREIFFSMVDDIAQCTPQMLKIKLGNINVLAEFLVTGKIPS